MNPISTIASITRTVAELYPANSGLWWVRIATTALITPLVLFAFITWIIFSHLSHGAVDYSALVWLFSALTITAWVAQVIMLLPLTLHEAVNYDARLQIVIVQGAAGVIPIILAVLGRPPPNLTSLIINDWTAPISLWLVIAVMIVLAGTGIPMIIGNSRRRVSILTGLDSSQSIIRTVEYTLMENQAGDTTLLRERVDTESQKITAELNTLTTPADVFSRALQFMADEDILVKTETNETRNSAIEAMRTDLLNIASALGLKSLPDPPQGRSVRAWSRRTGILLIVRVHEAHVAVIQLLIHHRVERLAYDFFGLINSFTRSSVERDAWLSMNAWNSYTNSMVQYIDEFEALIKRSLLIVDDFPFATYLPSWLSRLLRFLQYVGLVATREELHSSVKGFLDVIKLQLSHFSRAPFEDPRWKRVITAHRIRTTLLEKDVTQIRAGISHISRICDEDRQMILEDKARTHRVLFPAFTSFVASVGTQYFFNFVGWA
ncbi:hypothetical protein FQ377_13030 [Arthrobacter echini]|uniref:Uncharacterized protein n=1 Tax=Arthrobacter echini TaxID=1529066 RepID=A0A5D0XNZ6_9MICC|nr:hypothetical protein [Arthrobacter echini]TYC97551.1 hypothetical protein FQ377_13030 [Arthrobacter echini]